jgi:hypothetical protein
MVTKRCQKRVIIIAINSYWHLLQALLLVDHHQRVDNALVLDARPIVLHLHIVYECSVQCVVYVYVCCTCT